MPLVLALALATGGLGRLAWPRTATPTRGQELAALAVGLAGLALGFVCGGALVAVAGPCAALAGAALVEPPARHRRALVAGGAAVALGLLALLLRPAPAGIHSWLLGGIPRLGP